MECCRYEPGSGKVTLLRVISQRFQHDVLSLADRPVSWQARPPISHGSPVEKNLNNCLDVAEALAVRVCRVRWILGARTQERIAVRYTGRIRCHRAKRSPQ